MSPTELVDKMELPGRLVVTRGRPGGDWQPDRRFGLGRARETPSMRQTDPNGVVPETL